MTSLVHALQITTLATWLSVGIFGGIGIFIHAGDPGSANVSMPLETAVIPEDFTLGDPPSPETSESASGPTTPAESEILPAPPELPDATEQAPLPEIPELPSPAARLQETRRTTTARPTSSARTSRATDTRRSGGGTHGTASTGSMSANARLAAGRMPAPSYPPEARRKGQTGTVTVEFTVDTSGRVISAYAKNPSPWPLLDNEAVRTVLRWKFPPGSVMKLQRPIVFQLR